MKPTFTALIFLLSLHIQILSAQHTSVKGRFSIDYNTGCIGLVVTTSILPNDTVWLNPLFFYEGYATSKLGDPSTTHTYTEAGDYYITMFVKNDNLKKFDSVAVSIKTSELPKFKVHNCDKHQTVVEILDNYYDNYRVNFTPTISQLVAPQSFSNPHDYGSPSTPSIAVQGLFTDAFDNCGIVDHSFNTLSAIVAPVINFVETTKEDNSGEIRFSTVLGDDIIYQLDRAVDNHKRFNYEEDVAGDGHILQDINSMDHYHCFQIRTYDACEKDTIKSNIVCSVSIDVVGTDHANTITWKTDTVLAISYRILRNNQILVDISNSAITSYDDEAVICKKEYTYNVRPAYKVGFSIAADTIVVANKSAELPALSLPAATIDTNNAVIITWDPPDITEIPFKTYLIEKNIRDRAWKLIGNAELNTFTDLNPSLIGKHTYRVRYSDDCGNLTSPSPETIPIILRQKAIQGKNVTYEWNKYETWINGIRNYTVQRMDESGQVREEYEVLSGRNKEISFDENDSEDKLIRVKAESLDHTAKITYSNTISTSLGIEMYLPNVFTPDNQGPVENNKFVAKGPKVFNFKMDIYNRWGVLIFTTDDNFNGWDGTVNGIKVIEGVYIYKIYFADAENRDYSQTGSIMLMHHN